MSRSEKVVVGAVGLVLVILAAAEPDILEAPFQNGRTLAVAIGGLVLATAAFFALMRLGVPPPARLLAVGVPVVAASWWLLSPFFLDDVVHDEFEITIAAAQQTRTAEPASPPTTESTTAAPAGPTPPQVESTTTMAPVAPAGPMLLGTGSIVGLAGHDGSGDAAFFERPDGSHVLRFENFDIDNGPDLELYVVRGADQRVPGDGLHLGHLRGTVGDQTYELPSRLGLGPGDWTVLVWCQAFTVEFVAATVTIA